MSGDRSAVENGMTSSISENGWVSENEVPLDHQNREPIAIVGFSMRFPQGVESEDSFWKFLVEKRCASTDFPSERLSASARYHPDGSRRDTIPFRGGHFLEGDIAAFDAPFFQISATEAAALDPQQRGLLETTYRALENAGIPLKQAFGSKTSVHTGCFLDDYQQLALKDSEQCASNIGLSMGKCMFANRISWFFNFTGTSCQVDTACSSTLVALHLACNELINGDANMGVVAGSNLIFSPDPNLVLSNMNMLSPDSRCFSFDSRANGYARGEGFGTLILKRLSDAIRDRDVIRAVIRSTGSNSDGYTPGITQPSPYLQKRLIEETYSKAGLDLKPTRYMEAHATGTPTGDPIEMAAVGSLFRTIRTLDDPLIVGAVKANFGHSEGLSGIASLIKAILVLEKAMIPPNANFVEPNPKIDAEMLRIKFPVEMEPWPVKGLRRASINSFGYGGTNAHVVLDDVFHYLQDRGLHGNHLTVSDPPSIGVACPAATVQVNGRSQRDHAYLTKPQLLTLSACDRDGVNRLVSIFEEYFAKPNLMAKLSGTFLSDLAYTLNARRSSLPWRSHVSIDSVGDMQNLSTRISQPRESKKDPALCFVFTGQGAQWAGMGRELSVFPVFARSLERSEKYLRDLGCRWSLYEELGRSKKLSNINNPEFCQPLSTAIQIALVDLLYSLGVYPTVVVGHSSGEIAAAFAMGAITAMGAMKIAYYRGLLAAALAASKEGSGSMLAAGLDESEAQKYIDKVAKNFSTCGLTVACINSPRNVTISGDTAQIDTLKMVLDKDEIFARKLVVDVAYHSPHMEAIAREYGQSLGSLDAGIVPGTAPKMISTVTGQSVTNKQLRLPWYWVKNMVSPVKFASVLARVCEQSARTMRKKLDCSHRSQLKIDILLEVGPHSALQGPIRDILSDTTATTNISYVSTLVRYESSSHSLLCCAGFLHCIGYPIDLAKVNVSPNDARQPKLLTSLPQYPFNHSKRYWHESRISKRFRTDDQPKLDLLGKPISDWNPLEPQWRNFIRVSEMPWVEDHMINGTLLYPAAGMLVMAIEAVNQIANNPQAVIGFHLRNVTFQRALTIPQDSEGIETRFYLRKALNATPHEQSWFEFKLYSYGNEEFHENCSGLVRLQYGADQANSHDVREADEELTESRLIEAKVVQACTKPFARDELYKTLSSSGFGFGPAFQTLRNGFFGDTQSHADITTFEWPADEFPQPHIVHPTTLDGLLHLGLAALSHGGQQTIPTGVPSRIENLWVAKSGLNEVQTPSIRASTWITSSDIRGFTFDASVLNTSKEHVLVRMDGLKITLISDSAPAASPLEPEKRICHEFEVLPDIDLTSNDYLAAYFGEARLDRPDPIQFYSDLLFVSLIFLRRVLEPDHRKWSDHLQPHLYKYIDWAKLQIQRYNDGELPHSRAAWEDFTNDEEHFEKLCDSIEATNALGRAFIQTGRNLPKILWGEVDPLDFLFRSNLLKDLYHELSTDRTCFLELDRYLNTFAHKRPNMRILEIGAGTGGTTANILRTLSGLDGRPSYSCYHYTDLSPSFFEQAREMFSQYPGISYKSLDIESDPKVQGYEVESYDLIVAANVLHATKDIEATMHNVRKLLRPGGKLMMYEITRPDILRTGFVAGLMSGWWLGKEHYREWGPALNAEQWDTCLRNTGFSGLDFELPDFVSEECHELSILLTTAISTSLSPRADLRLVIIAKTNSESQMQSAHCLREHLDHHGAANCTIQTMHDAADSAHLDKSILIFVEELEQPLLMDISEERYSQLQAMLTVCHGAVWVNAGGGSLPSDPAYAIASGLFRALRNEYPQKRLATISLDRQGLLAHHQLRALERIICAFDQEENRLDLEPEYVEIKGAMTVPRVQESNRLMEDLHERSLPRQSAVQAIKDSPPLKLVIGSPGSIDTLHFIEQSWQHPLDSDEVEVRVHAIGVSSIDHLRAVGKLSGTYFGQECAGVVTRIGSKSDVVPGDRVVMYAFEGSQTTGRWRLDQICKVPDALSILDAVRIPIQFGAAWEVLHEIARVRRGDTVLVTSAAEASGQAIVQVAKYTGAQVFATVRSDDEKQLLLQKYSLSGDHVFYDGSTRFAKEIKSLTAGRGVDTVLNDLTGDGLLAALECVAKYGRFIDFSVDEVSSNIQLPLSSKRKNINYISFDYLSWLEDEPERAVENLDVIMPLVGQGYLHVVQPLHVHDISRVGQVLRSMHEGKTIGKHVLEVQPDSMVPTILDTKPKYSLDLNATYVIAGGLGGIGRSIARWMVSRGARNLLLLSRSGPKSETSQAFVTELEAQGVHVKAPPCDIADYTALEYIFKEAATDMPPVRGCIQAAMVLSDALYEIMSYTSWLTATQPKIAGSWNLHALLPPSPADLDFFILLSSIDGIIGLPGQANYAAGNTYLDALARYRVSRGQKAVSLDLGVMVDDGFLAENEDVRKRVLGFGTLEPVERRLMEAMLDYYCDPDLPLQTPQQSQAIIGLGKGKANGGESMGLGGADLLRHPLFRHVRHQAALQSSTANPTSSTATSNSATTSAAAEQSTAHLRTAFLSASSLPAAAQTVSTALLRKLSRSLPSLQSLLVEPETSPTPTNTAATAVDFHAPLSKYGLDSLVAVEIRGWLRRELAADVAVFEILGGASLSSLGMLVAGGRSKLVGVGQWDQDREDKEGEE